MGINIQFVCEKKYKNGYNFINLRLLFKNESVIMSVLQEVVE